MKKTKKETELKIAETFRRANNWPRPISNDALHGLAGFIVRTIEPHTEADPVALLLQLLTATGNIIGRGPHFKVEASKHYLKLFTVLCGRSAKARKGSSWGHISRLLKEIDQEWHATRIKPGLISGEGLIWEVRDQIQEQKAIKKDGLVTDYQNVITDHGVKDKRLLILEEEFASILKVISRGGNTLSPTIRKAWDSGVLSTMAKNNPAIATSSHISIIVHTTIKELKESLNLNEMANGFANRFLFAFIKRSKSLPLGGNLCEKDLYVFFSALKEVVKYSKSVGELTRSDEATELWCKNYESLSEGKPGLLGSVTARAEAQVMRLASLYALLDMSPVIDLVHLKAALAVWKYCEDSARFIFGDDLGDPLADEIKRILDAKPDGMSRTEISHYFQNNKGKTEIDRALDVLLECGLTFYKKIKTGGKPKEIWLSIKYK